MGMLNNITTYASAINALSRYFHNKSRSAGWWHDPITGEELVPRDLAEGQADFRPYVIATKLCLIHSEISEAMEGHRKGLMDDKLPHRPMIEVELADAMIRIFDLAGQMGLDLGGAIMEKGDFNSERPDHKTDNRRKPGGKLY